MTPLLKHVFYVRLFGLPAFASALQARGDVQLMGLADDSPDDETTASVLSAAHVYQITSGVNDVQARWWLTDALLARTPHLLLASAIGSGYDTVDVSACTRAGVLVVNQAGGGNAEAVAEHMFAVMIALSKRIMEADRRMRRAPGVVRGHYVGRNVLGKTAGIIGFGHVGRRLAELCRLALRMRVLVHDSHRTPDEIISMGAEVADLDRLLGSADYVLVCCSLNEETRGLLSDREFCLMKPQACFVNAARGGIHDEAALYRALVEGRLAAAGIDVWDTEPPEPSHPLLSLDNVIATPHIAGATVESRIDAAESGARQILEVLDGRRPPRLLNPEAWPLFARRFEAMFGFRPSD